MKAKDIIEVMEKLAPAILIDEWDNTGFQIGDNNSEISKVLISLDLTDTVLNKAIEEGYEMIITHHPVIFKPLTSITNTDPKGQLILNLINNNIVAFNAHSNLDLAIGGVNDELADLFQLKNTRPLTKKELNYKSDFMPNNSLELGYGRVGEVDDTDLMDFLDEIKIKLDLEHLIVYGNTKKKINKIAICGGSGSDFIYNAFSLGADLYITGDIKYHDAEYGVSLGLTIVDPGHYHTEKIILPKIKEYLGRELNDKINIDIFQGPNVATLIY